MKVWGAVSKTGLSLASKGFIRLPEGGLPDVASRTEIWGTQEQETFENTRQGDSGTEQYVSRKRGSRQEWP